LIVNPFRLKPVLERDPNMFFPGPTEKYGRQSSLLMLTSIDLYSALHQVQSEKLGMEEFWGILEGSEPGIVRFPFPVPPPKP